MKVKIQFRRLDGGKGGDILEFDVPPETSFQAFVMEANANGVFLNSHETDWLSPHLIERIWKV